MRAAGTGRKSQLPTTVAPNLTIRCETDDLSVNVLEVLALIDKEFFGSGAMRMPANNTWKRPGLGMPFVESVGTIDSMLSLIHI